MEYCIYILKSLPAFNKKKTEYHLHLTDKDGFVRHTSDLFPHQSVKVLHTFKAEGWAGPLIFAYSHGAISQMKLPKGYINHMSSIEQLSKSYNR